MTERRAVSTPNAPAAIGPYSQAMVAGGFAFTSGQIALDPESGEMVGTDAGSQAAQVLDNLEAVLRAAGSSLANAVKVNIYLADMNDFIAVNEVYGARMSSPAPARATVEVARLPKDALIEIDMVAVVSDAEPG